MGLLDTVSRLVHRLFHTSLTLTLLPSGLLDVALGRPVRRDLHSHLQLTMARTLPQQPMTCQANSPILSRLPCFTGARMQ